MTTLLAAALMLQHPMNTRVPELASGEWVNSKEAIKLADRKGKVTFVHFWTFACYNCKNNLPAIKRLTEKFKEDGVVTIGIHTPEIKIEKDPEQVKAHIKKYNIEYPNLIDGEYKNWNAWKVTAWPTLFVVDKRGVLRGGWIGELNFNGQRGEDEIAKLVRQLLTEK